MTILSLTAEERHVPAANLVIGFNTIIFNDSGRMLEDPLIPQRGGTEENEETD
jgi:hypothetical protein